MLQRDIIIYFLRNGCPYIVIDKITVIANASHLVARYIKMQFTGTFSNISSQYFDNPYFRTPSTVVTVFQKMSVNDIYCNIAILDCDIIKQEELNAEGIIPK